jgi:rhodanese-related sulfurtransferase
LKTISKEELSSRLDSGRLVVVNVLRKEAFEKIHIRGSISIPRSELEAGRWRELDKTKEVVVHCSSYECAASRMAADFLESKDYNVKAYEGGLKEWAEAGLPMEGAVSSQKYLEERYGRPAAAPSAAH